jgi:hypothetical protein
MQIGGEDVENLLVNMMLEKKNLWKHTNLNQTQFHASFNGNGLNWFQFETLQVTATTYETLSCPT